MSFGDGSVPLHQRDVPGTDNGCLFHSVSADELRAVLTEADMLQLRLTSSSAD